MWSPPQVKPETQGSRIDGPAGYQIEAGSKPLPRPKANSGADSSTTQTRAAPGFDIAATDASIQRSPAAISGPPQKAAAVRAPSTASARPEGAFSAAACARGVRTKRSPPRRARSSSGARQRDEIDRAPTIVDELERVPAAVENTLDDQSSSAMISRQFGAGSPRLVHSSRPRVTATRAPSPKASSGCASGARASSAPGDFQKLRRRRASRSRRAR